MTTMTHTGFTCAAQTYSRTTTTPTEYCENEVEEEDALCEEHDGSDFEDAAERAYDDWKEPW